MTVRFFCMRRENHATFFIEKQRPLLEIQRKSLWILGIDQDRNQAAFRIGWGGVHDPGPKSIGSPCARIRPRRSEVIVVT